MPLPEPLDILVPLLWAGRVTVAVTVLGLALAIAISIPGGFARMSRWRLIRTVAAVYIETIRGTSLLVQLFLLYYVLPQVGITLGAFETGVFGLGLHFGAFGSEIVRAAILNVDRRQREAAIALSLSGRETMRYIIFPQALVAMIPPFGNITVQALKGSALVSLISISEVVSTGRALISTTGRSVEVFTLVFVVYLLLALPLIRGLRWLEAYTSRGVGTGRPAQ